MKGEEYQKNALLGATHPPAPTGGCKHSLTKTGSAVETIPAWGECAGTTYEKKLKDGGTRGTATSTYKKVKKRLQLRWHMGKISRRTNATEKGAGTLKISI